MKQIDSQRFIAEEGQTFVHKTTEKRMGNRIYLGTNDSIENYEELPMTEEELKHLEDEKKEHEIPKEDKRKRR